MSSSDGPVSVTLRYDSKGNITGFGSKYGTGAVSGAKETVGSVVVDYGVIEEFAALGYSYSSLRIKDERVVLPFSAIFKRVLMNFYKDIFYIRRNVSHWLNRANLFFGNTALGQILIVIFLSGIAVWIIDIGTNLTSISQSVDFQFINFYVPIFASLLAISFGVIGLNNAERRYRDTRKLEVSPVFVFESDGVLDNFQGYEKTFRVAYQNSEIVSGENSKIKPIYGKFSIRNEGKGVAFNTWVFLEKEEGIFNMNGSFILCSGEKKTLLVTVDEDIQSPVRIYVVSNNIDNDLIVFGAILSINAKSKDSTIVSNHLVRENEFKFREIYYTIKNFGRG